MTRYHHYGHVQVLRIHTGEDVQTVPLGHFHVQEDDVYMILPELLEGSLTILGFHHLILFVLQNLPQRPADAGFIVDDKNDGVGHMVRSDQIRLSRQPAAEPV